MCVCSKGRADNYPKQHSKSPVIQVDITYYKAMGEVHFPMGETKATPTLTAVDVETGMCMAVQVEDRTQQMQYLFSMFTTIPYGMRQNTSNTQQHGDTTRSRRLLDGTAQDDSNSSRKHSSQTITSILITNARQRWMIPQNITWTSQSTQVTTWEQLRHTPHKQTSHHAVDGQARSLPSQQVRSTWRRQRQLLQTLEQRTHDTNLWVWWNSTLHVTNSKAQA